MMARRGWQRWVSAAGVAGEVVKRHLDGLAGLEVLKVPDQQGGLERVGVVVIERGAIFEPQVVAIAVVTVVLEDDDVFRAEAVYDPTDDSGLT